MGYWANGKAPCATSRSLWQTPQAWTRIRTCPNPGVGRSRSSTETSPCGSFMTIALIASPLVAHARPRCIIPGGPAISQRRSPDRCVILPQTYIMQRRERPASHRRFRFRGRRAYGARGGSGPLALRAHGVLWRYGEGALRRSGPERGAGVHFRDHTLPRRPEREARSHSLQHGYGGGLGGGP